MTPSRGSGEYKSEVLPIGVPTCQVTHPRFLQANTAGVAELELQALFLSRSCFHFTANIYLLAPLDA